MEDMSYMRHGICIFKNVNVEVPQGAARRQKQRLFKHFKADEGIPSLQTNMSPKKRLFQ